MRVSRPGEGKWWTRSPTPVSLALGLICMSARRKDYVVTTAEECNLYDVNNLVIKPATSEDNCSLVELMATWASLLQECVEACRQGVAQGACGFRLAQEESLPPRKADIHVQTSRRLQG